MRTLIICIALFFFSTLIHAQEVEIPSKYGSASEQAKELMKKNNVIMSQECGNITVTISGNTKTKLVINGNVLVATTNQGKDLLVFSYETYDDTVTIYSINYKTQRFSILQPPTLKSLDFKDCNCDFEPKNEAKNLAKYLQITDPQQWFHIHVYGGYEYWDLKYYEESGSIKGFVKPRSMKCCSTGFSLPKN